MLRIIIVLISICCMTAGAYVYFKNPTDPMWREVMKWEFGGVGFCCIAVGWLEWYEGEPLFSQPIRRGFQTILKRKAFTLIELMISLAMMVLLMYGVNLIFSSVGKATGAAQTLSRINRDVQAGSAVMYQDFANIALDGPFLEIHSERQAAFKNRADQLADLDYTTGTTPGVTDAAILSINVNGTNADDTSIPRTIYGQRNFRLDTISFFARGTYPRQTGNDGEYIANQSGAEAWIWYGHLKQADPTGATNAYLPPGTDAVNGTSPTLNATTSPNNFYATQWVLGRKVTILIPESDKPTGSVGPAKGVWDNSIPPVYQMYIQRSPSALVTSLAPLEQVASKSVDNLSQIQWSRYDVAATSISGYTTTIKNALTSNPAMTWWDGGHIDYRFQGNPLPPRPLNSAGVARTVPVFLPNCTSFIVEYAGDFLTQDVNGLITAAGPDGTIDYIPSATAGRQIRWYGFPRDIDGDGVIAKATDVVPLRDVRPGGAALFERITSLPPKADYASLATPIANNATYVCAWGPDTLTEPKPKMIRVTLTVDDPNGAIAQPPSFEYVFKIQ